MHRHVHVAFVGSLLLVGCQQAARFDPGGAGRSAEQKGDNSEAKRDKPLDRSLQWQENQRAQLPPAILIEFVTLENDPETWKKLPKYWNDPTPTAAITLLTPSPLTAVALAGIPQPVRIKVPRGLPDPRPHIPAANPPTLAKWQLGRELFFDRSWLYEKKSQSCAECHIPSRNYTDSEQAHEGYNTPTLVNVVYNRRQFWDGRATHLEEVIQRTLEDERETERTNGSTHLWGGVVDRLRHNPFFLRRFREVFGTDPTQDNLGRAVATYLRTILAGDSVYDRALAHQRDRSGKEMESADVEAVLTEADLPLLNRSGKKPSSVAADLFHGYRLFFDLEKTRTVNCAKCHSGPLFTDGSFHNIGVGFDYNEKDSRFPETLGHYAHAPFGEKTGRLMGAFKTPTLRGLSRTAPYLHNGKATTLEDVVRRYNNLAGEWNLYLDPLLLKKGDWPQLPRLLDLDDEEINDLALFLRSLTGAPVDAAVATPPPPPK
jgi:cytochrome c peroxidase